MNKDYLRSSFFHAGASPNNKVCRHSRCNVRSQVLIGTAVHVSDGSFFIFTTPLCLSHANDLFIAQIGVDDE